MTRYLFRCLLLMVGLAVSSTAVGQSLDSSRFERLPPVQQPFFLESPELVLRFQESSVENVFAQAASSAHSIIPAGFASDCKGCDGGCAGCSKSDCGHSGCFAGVCCKRPGEITFKPGLRIQSRYTYFDNTNDNDFFIRRFRMKGSGEIFDLGKYGAELKTDSSEKFGDSSEDTGGLPTPVVENAWVDFILRDELAYLRVGLYDIPFSRNALTSDSKLLLMDRTEVKNALTRIGFADNTVGVMLHGRPAGGYIEYAVGVFDNIRYDANPGAQSDQLMPCGRIALNLLDPDTSLDGYADYRESYLGQGRRLVIGMNAASTSDIIDPAFPGNPYDVYAWGIDLFFNVGRVVFQAEYDWFSRDLSGGAADNIGEGWYVQAGYIFDSCWEVAARYQTVDDPINGVAAYGTPQIAWTQIGVNYYFHEHNLKVQSDYNWRNEDGTEIANDGFQLQLQLDF